MSEGGDLLYAYLQPLGEETAGMEAGTALGFSLPPGEGEVLLGGLSLLAPQGEHEVADASQHGLPAS